MTLPPSNGGLRTRAAARLSRLLWARPRRSEHDPETGSFPERGIDAHAALVVVLVAALSAALGGYLLWRARPHASDVGPAPAAVVVAEATAAPLPRSFVAAALPATPSPSPTAVADPGIVVDVQGRVRRPGTVNLPTGARVRDALNAAGGPREGTSTRSLNLAAPLRDGEQIVLGPDCPGTTPAGVAPSAALAPGAPALGAGAASASGAPSPPWAAAQRPVAPAAPVVLDLNRATAAELETLPGIGPVLAERIVAYRTRNGRFTSVEELREVSGIGAAKLAQIRSRVRV